MLTKQDSADALQEKYSIELQPVNFIELDSSNDVKFSRHLIALAPDACFRSNAHVGKFIEEMLLQDADTELLQSNRDISSLLLSKVSHSTSS